MSVNEEQLDPELRRKLNVLVAKKNQAVAVEDFDSAMDLKEISDKLKLIGSDLIMLEARKTEAIQGEDFETAKALKI